MLDGAKHLRIFFQIVLPNAAAPIATLALLTFIGQWNEYFWPLLVASQDDVRVLQVGLGVFKSQSPQGAPDWSGLMAATLDRDAEGNLVRKAGVMAVVREGGEVRAGDAIAVMLPPGPHRRLVPV